MAPRRSDVATRAETAFGCRCGGVRGTADLAGGFHVRCFCTSCAGTQRLAGAPDPAGAGVPLVQIAPDRLRFERGADRMAPLKLFGRSKVLRWRATCCGDVLFSSALAPWVPIYGIMTRVVDAPEAAGPERARVYLPGDRHEGLGRLARAFVARTGRALLRGAPRRDPLARRMRYPAPARPPEDEMARAFPDGEPL